MIVQKAVEGGEVTQDFDPESVVIGDDHSQKMKASSIATDSELKSCVTFSRTACSRKVLENISVTVLAKNSQKYLKEVLQALLPFGEVVLYDTGSTDETISIAESFPNVRVIRAPFIGFGPTHNAASAMAKHEWILSVDSDEIMSPDALKAIAAEDLHPGKVYSFPRHNYFNGKFIRWCGWYPDRQMRLYHKGKTRFSDAQVHEAIIAEGLVRVPLQGPIIHYSYDSIANFLSKMQSYSTLFAEQYRGKRKSSLGRAIGHGFFAFFKSYFLKLGILSGYEGFVISAYNGHTAYYKYLKLYEFNSEKIRR
ncbi:MAG: glycosyltransferase family 2 protein [Parachlamydiaceae bacterium]